MFKTTNTPCLLLSIRVDNLSNVLRDTENCLLKYELTEWQDQILRSALEDCHTVLTTLGQAVDKNRSLDTSEPLNPKAKTRKFFTRLTWNSTKIREYRSRITLNVGLLQAINGNLNK